MRGLRKDWAAIGPSLRVRVRPRQILEADISGVRAAAPRMTYSEGGYRTFSAEAKDHVWLHKRGRYPRSIASYLVSFQRKVEVNSDVLP